MRHNIIGAHIRKNESIETHSFNSEDPNSIIEWLGWMIEKLARVEVLFDHDYSKDNYE